MNATLRALPWWHPKREPAVYIGFILTVLGELATLAQAHPKWPDLVLAAIPILTGALVRQFVTPYVAPTTPTITATVTTDPSTSSG